MASHRAGLTARPAGWRAGGPCRPSRREAFLLLCQLSGEDVAYGLIVATYRRRMGVIAVREMARHRYRQSQYAGLTRLQLDEVGRERQVQRQGARRADALAEGSVELAQAMVPQALALARGGG